MDTLFHLFQLWTAQPCAQHCINLNVMLLASIICYKRAQDWQNESSIKATVLLHSRKQFHCCAPLSSLQTWGQGMTNQAAEMAASLRAPQSAQSLTLGWKTLLNGLKWFNPAGSWTPHTQNSLFKLLTQNTEGFPAENGKIIIFCWLDIIASK